MLYCSIELLLLNLALQPLFRQYQVVRCRAEPGPYSAPRFESRLLRQSEGIDEVAGMAARQLTLDLIDVIQRSDLD